MFPFYQCFPGLRLLFFDATTLANDLAKRLQVWSTNRKMGCGSDSSHSRTVSAMKSL